MKQKKGTMAERFKLENFRSGIHYPGEGFRYFLPEKVNVEWTWEDPHLTSLLEEASRNLGELNSYAKLVPDVDQFIRLHVLKEALVSSRIEGTRTNIDEALMEERDIPTEKRDDWNEVQNHIRALDHAIEKLEELPLSTRLLKEVHGILMEGVRGEHKNPGEFRRSQNWIGGKDLQHASFIPPSHVHVQDLMGDLEKFIHDQEIRVPLLVRAGIVHYQFETIHPFLDGNGRIGRLMIPLYLIGEGALEKPLLYLSTYFERDKVLYYDRLMRVRDKNELLEWLIYFLQGIAEASQEAANTLANVLELKRDLEKKLREGMGRRTQGALTLFESLFRDPLTSIGEVQEICELSPRPAGELVKELERMEILKEVTGRQRNRIYRFEPYVELFRA